MRWVVVLWMALPIGAAAADVSQCGNTADNPYRIARPGMLPRLPEYADPPERDVARPAIAVSKLDIGGNETPPQPASARVTDGNGALQM